MKADEKINVRQEERVAGTARCCVAAHRTAAALNVREAEVGGHAVGALALGKCALARLLEQSSRGDEEAQAKGGGRA